MSKITSLFILVLMVCGASCKSPQRTVNRQHDLIHQDQTPTVDPGGTLVLFLGKISPTDAGGKATFCVHEKKGMKLIEERVYRPGFARWSGVATLEYQDMPGVMRADQREADFIKTISFKRPENP